MTSTALEEARYGNPGAITALINRTLQKKGISASVDLDHGDLDVMLDGKQVPPETAADYVCKGIQKLDIEPAYDLHVFGRKAGEPFATWCHNYELKPRPFELVSSSARQQKAEPSAQGLTIKLADANGEAIAVDPIQLLGFAGIAITIFGIFSPIMTAPIMGTVNYFRNGTAEAIVLVILTTCSAFFLARRHYSWLYGPSVWAFLLVGGTFMYYQFVIWDLKASVDEELAGNPFRGIADAAMAGTGLSWGWFFLFLGTGLVVTAAYLKKRKLDKQAFVALIMTLVIAVIATIVTVVHLGFATTGQADQARESEAQTYIGSINRGQQAYFLESSDFADSLDKLGLGIQEETDNYKYEITLVEDDMSMVTAIPQKRGLRSFTGAVFLVEDPSSDYETTKAILCQSDSPSRTAPSLPTASRSGELQCASGSSEP